jgi:Fur family iron response transcriptional regulator
MDQERPFSQVLRRLRGVGLRPTRQRLVLAKLLFADDKGRHISAEKLHEEALAAEAKVSLATVYNTLHQFTDAGLLREIVVDSGRTYFDTNTSNHYHFFIEEEGDLIDVPADAVPLTRLPPPPAGKKIARVDVVIRLADGDQAS